MGVLTVGVVVGGNSTELIIFIDRIGANSPELIVSIVVFGVNSPELIVVIVIGLVYDVMSCLYS